MANNPPSNIRQSSTPNTSTAAMSYGTDGTNISTPLEEPNSNTSLITPTDIQKNVSIQVPRTKIFATKFITKWNFQLRPKGRVDKFCIETIIAGLLKSIVKVHPQAWLKSWNTEDAPPVYSLATIPKTDDDMNLYVENPHTTSAGNFRRLYGRITLVSSLPAETIKYDPDFGTWIQEKGLFLDRSELENTRPKCIGLFDKTFATSSKIHYFTAYLKKTQ